MTSLGDVFLMLSNLWRGGNYGYFWRKADKKTVWCDLHEPYRIPTGGDDVYWGVHPTTMIPPTNAQGVAMQPCSVRGQIPYVAAVGCLFAEFDVKDFSGSHDLTRTFMRNRLLAPPSAIIASGGGYHAYWFLSQPVVLADGNRGSMDAIQKRFVAVTGGDDGAKDMARVLRVPGTCNSKYDPPRMVEFVEFSRVEYELADLIGMIEAAAPLPDIPNPIQGSGRSYGSGSGSLAAFVAASQEGERNKRLFWASNRALDKGATIADVEAEIVPAALRAGLPEGEVRTTVRSASAQQRRST